ncbi:MAG: hypothetical protein JWM47_2263 [Acidimicrobiales bacterium]|nr:hypothetical protein [Acidimicrobiales bacterium]
MSGTSTIRHITVDCRAPYALARFWAAALGFTDDPGNPNAPGDPEALIVDPRGLHPGLLFLPVPEPKVVKNRVHLDLVPGAARDVTVDQLLALGATLVDDQRRADGSGWAVLADPEGNELCIERSAAERGDPPPRDLGERSMRHLHAADERAMLEGMLEWYRTGVLTKLDGISLAALRAAPVRSGTTIAGLVKHLALVEDFWFHVRFAGGEEPEPWASAPFDDDPDWEFHTAAEDSVADLVAQYRTSCERSRQAIAGRSLDDTGADASRGPFTLRYAVLHLIEETARHLGHLDILRELQDATSGE